MNPDTITEHYARKQNGDGLFYLAAGPEDGPLVIFIHGWPELSISWTSQIKSLARLGFRAIAPDMPGYGRSIVYKTTHDYRMENIVNDMRFLLQSLSSEKAVWIGHDVGSLVLWSLASHHPEICNAVASVGVPYRTVEVGIPHMLTLIDRNIYPEARYPTAQLDYRFYYNENFERATRVFDAAPENVIKAIFVRGNPDDAGKPHFIADVRKDGGWFGGADTPPDYPLDTTVLTEEEWRTYSASLRKNGFFGADSYYMNHAENEAYAAATVNNSYLDMPVLFIHTVHDYALECIDNILMSEGMRRLCRNFTSTSIESGHWTAHEKPVELASALTHWLATTAKIWPKLVTPNWRPLKDK